MISYPAIHTVPRTGQLPRLVVGIQDVGAAILMCRGVGLVKRIVEQQLYCKWG